MISTSNQQRQTPVLNFADSNLQQRIAAGSAHNLTAEEQAQLSTEMAHFNQDLAAFQTGGGGMNRKELWAEATQISHNIYDLRHNDLGTMGPTNPSNDHESYHQRMLEGWLKDKDQNNPPVAGSGPVAQPGPIAYAATSYGMGGGWAAAAGMQFR
jgi:hypothetical protein